ncbi:Piso0_003345 [Millerozyma farinosa CBS 7064]|uniref:Piso0_003345 protein n=1 Tax=Pichia sorbitophila (strain ATCC MYA-4447 / BCRC 22081 / CBS 7064 / NBRC 10061 / NRRL Y-12695) TaxID=559304 RepID=G8YIU7_PICSO|nr:Piso0_003345 [Millerozyma farinosa CBS 7064]CCE81007.1 Piso0_003345 [Millerozyma farinosa CBS 7064]
MQFPAPARIVRWCAVSGGAGAAAGGVQRGGSIGQGSEDRRVYGANRRRFFLPASEGSQQCRRGSLANDNRRGPHRAFARQAYSRRSTPSAPRASRTAGVSIAACSRQSGAAGGTVCCGFVCTQSPRLDPRFRSIAKGRPDSLRSAPHAVCDNFVGFTRVHAPSSIPGNGHRQRSILSGPCLPVLSGSVYQPTTCLLSKRDLYFATTHRSPRRSSTGLLSRSRPTLPVLSEYISGGTLSGYR